MTDPEKITSLTSQDIKDLQNAKVTASDGVTVDNAVGLISGYGSIYCFSTGRVLFGVVSGATAVLVPGVGHYSRYKTKQSIDNVLGRAGIDISSPKKVLGIFPRRAQADLGPFDR